MLGNTETTLEEGWLWTRNYLRILPPGEGATMTSIESSEVEELAEQLEPLGLYIDSDALVIVPSEDGPPQAELPETSITRVLKVSH